MPGTLLPDGRLSYTSTAADIFGWFDWPQLYARAIETAPDGGLLIEVGVFLGKSLTYLGERAKAEGRGLRVVGVDRWLGSAEFEESVWFNDVPINQTEPGDVLAICYANLVRRRVVDVVTLVVGESDRTAGLFADGSAHMVFIDAAHDEASVQKDIAAWMPKVRPGGLLAGHDYGDPTFPGVQAAVDRAFGKRVQRDGMCWEVRA